MKGSIQSFEMNLKRSNMLQPFSSAHGSDHGRHVASNDSLLDHGPLNRFMDEKLRGRDVDPNASQFSNDNRDLDYGGGSRKQGSKANAPGYGSAKKDRTPKEVSKV